MSVRLLCASVDLWPCKPTRVSEVAFVVMGGAEGFLWRHVMYWALGDTPAPHSCSTCSHSGSCCASL